jgi:flavin-dependent dehydrogenase
MPQGATAPTPGPRTRAAPAFAAAVIGGGPAGAVTALCLARRGLRVALFEATRFNGPRYGETLPPEINPLVKTLGLWERFLTDGHLESPGIVSAWGTGERSESDFVRNVHGCGWHLDRRRFDAMLCRAAEDAGAVVFRGARVLSCRRKAPRGWELTVHGRAAPPRVRAEVVVDASGRNGHRLGGKVRFDVEDRLLAIVMRLEHDGGRPRDLRTYLEATPDGWWYSAPLPGRESIAMFFTDRETYLTTGAELGPLLERSPLTRPRFAAARLLESRVLHVPSAVRAPAADDDCLAVGDSAAAYDPLSGRGIFKAFRHAMAAADAVHASLNGESGALAAYGEQVGQDFAEYAALRRMYYAQETRWVEAGFWRRRVTPVIETTARRGTPRAAPDPGYSQPFRQ